MITYSSFVSTFYKAEIFIRNHVQRLFIEFMALAGFLFTMSYRMKQLPLLSGLQITDELPNETASSAFGPSYHR